MSSTYTFELSDIELMALCTTLQHYTKLRLTTECSKLSTAQSLAASSLLESILNSADATVKAIPKIDTKLFSTWQYNNESLDAIKDFAKFLYDSESPIVGKNEGLEEFILRVSRELPPETE